MDSEIVMILLQLALLVAIVVYALLRGGNPDKELAAKLVELHREHGDRLERAYAKANDSQRQIVDIAAGILRTIAPVTPIVSDDTVSDLLDDITDGEAE